MSRNGSGVYTMPTNSWNNAVGGTTIDPSDWNTTSADIETAISESVARDGQTTITANLPMATFRHTGVGNAAALADYVSGNDLTKGTLVYEGTVAGTADVITATMGIAPAAYTEGMEIRFKVGTTNTGTVTINVDSLGAKNIRKQGGVDLVAGDLQNNAIALIVYDGSDFELLTSGPGLTTRGDMIRGDSTGNPERLALGTSGQVVSSDGTDLSWAKVPPVTTRGDAVRGNSSGVAERLALGADNTMLTSDGTDLVFEAVEGKHLTLATEVAGSTANIDFTGIPSWVKRITIQFVSLSQSSDSNEPVIQLGDAGGIETTGYLGSAGTLTSSGQTVIAPTTGFGFIGGIAAANVFHGTCVLTLEDSANDTWVASITMGLSDAGAMGLGAGSKSLSATLDRVRITTSGVDTWAGSVNIQYD